MARAGEPLLGPTSLDDDDLCDVPRITRLDSGTEEYEHRLLYVHKRGKYSNIAACVVNLVLCQLGLGTLAMPRSYVIVGWVEGSALMVIFAGVSAYALYLLDKTCRALPLSTKSDSIAGLVDALYGTRGAYALELLMFLLSLGVMSSYFGPIGLELSTFVQWLLQPESGGGVDGLLQPLPFRLFMAVFVISPMSLLPEHVVQGFIGLAATGCTLFTMAVVAVQAPWLSLLPPTMDACAGARGVEASDVEPISSIPSIAALVEAAPLFVFSYNAPTGFLPIRAQLWRPQSDPRRGVGRRKVLALIVLGQAVLCLNYTLTALIGYMTFCASTPAMVLDGYPSNMPLPLAGRLVLGVQLCLVITGAWLPLNRGAIWTLLRGLHAPMPFAVRVILTILCLAIPITISTLLGGSLALPLGLTSSVCLTTFMFILPGAVAYSARALGDRPHERAIPLLFGVLGVMVATVSTWKMLASASRG